MTCGLAGFLIGVIRVIGLIVGIIYLIKTAAEFEAEYLDAEKDWF